MKQRTLGIGFLAVCLTFSSSAVVQAGAKAEGAQVVRPGASRIVAGLLIGPRAALGQVADVRCTLLGKAPQREAAVRLVLSDGLELVTGPETQRVVVGPNERTQLSWQVLVRQEGAQWGRLVLLEDGHRLETPRVLAEATVQIPNGGEARRTSLPASVVVPLPPDLGPSPVLKNPRLTSDLLELARAAKKGQGTAGGRSQSAKQAAGSARLTVMLYMRHGWQAGPSDRALMAQLDVQWVKQIGDVVEVTVSPAELEALAERLPDLRFIGWPRTPRPAATTVDPLETQGVALTGADTYHAIGDTAAGVPIAIIDMQWGNIAQQQQAGELPASLTMVDCTGSSCVETTFPDEEVTHGTKCAEVVYDMAPDAPLVLIKIANDLDMWQAKDYCIANGISLISASLTEFNSNDYDGACYDSSFVCSVEDGWSHGILWTNSAGNYALSHYAATFTDNNGDGWDDYPQAIHITSDDVTNGNLTIGLYLTWNDWPASSIDLDVYLTDSSGHVKASSTNPQTGTQHPTESLQYTCPAQPGYYYVWIKNRTAGSAPDFDLFGDPHDLLSPIALASIANPADAPHAFSVAAINQARWTFGPVEDYSSRGPNHAGLIKPEISGPTDVHTGLDLDFTGTSAATPHVAGAAALILYRHPDYTAADLWTALATSAIDMGSTGQDYDYGYGRLELPRVKLLALEPIENIADAYSVGHLLYFYIDVPAGLTQLDIATNSGIGDVDLYVRAPGTPAPNWDCSSESGTNDELCTFQTPLAGRWIIGLSRSQAYSGVTLSANFLPPTLAMALGGNSADGLFSAIQTTDGGYLLAGEVHSWGNGGYDGWVVKLDAGGNRQWAKNFGGANYDRFNSAIQTTDGGYLLVGFVESWGNGGYDGWVVKLDAAGNQQWTKNFGGAGTDGFRSTIQTTDGGYVLAGYEGSWGNGGVDGWVMKLDATGTRQWAASFGGAGGDFFETVQQTSDGGYILAGHEDSWGYGNMDGWVMKLDAGGNRQWANNFGGTNGDQFQAVDQTADGGYLLAGSEYSWGNGQADGWVMKLDATGTRQWARNFGGTSGDFFEAVQQASDGGYILAGWELSWGNGDRDGWVMKLDASGNRLWTNNFGGANTDFLYAVQQTADGGYILAGEENSWGNGGYDGWVMKLDASGNH